VDRAFKLLQKITNVIQTKPGTKRTQVSRFDAKGPSGRPSFFRVEPQAEIFIHDVLERPTATSRFRLELGGNIIIQSESGSHALMIAARHHDVKCAAY
jgi:hypothetical protein